MTFKLYESARYAILGGADNGIFTQERGSSFLNFDRVEITQTDGGLKFVHWLRDKAVFEAEYDVMSGMTLHLPIEGRVRVTIEG